MTSFRSGFFQCAVGRACAVLCVAGLAVSALAAPTTSTAPASDIAPVTSVDLRPILENWGLSQRLQGHRGTCSVFALTGAIEYALAGRERHATRLSVEFLNWASNEATGTREDGSFFSDLWKGFVRFGTCFEADMPYQGEFDPKNRPSEEARGHAEIFRDAGLQMHWIKRWNPTHGVTDAQLLRIKHVLAEQWPVAGGFLWPKGGHEQWPEHVLQVPARENVFDGHSLLLVGYRDDPAQPGGGVFIIRNSARLGREAYVPYEYARQYMNDAVWVDFDTEATTSPGTFPSSDLLGRLGATPTGRNRRVSSNQQPQWNDGDDDLTWLMPGDSATMPALRGPGVITHMWFTSHAGFAGELDSLVLRIYYDERKDPGVEAPLGNFFAVGQGRPAVVESVPVQVSPTGSLSCYWRMPFRESARITVTNENPDRYTGLYWQVDYTQVEQLPPDTPYFHAKYRQEYPAQMGRDYVLADLAGSGWYVGTVLSVTLAQDGWFGEGDDFFYIDGEQVPSLQGTGSEDYFNDAWGFRPRTSHWFGQPRWQGDQAGDSGVAYRWHLPDPVHFGTSLKVAIEHKGNCADDADGFFLERPDFLSSVAFWYQTDEPKPFGEMPPYAQRRVPWEYHHLVKAFREAKVTGESKPRVSTTGFFGSRPVLTWAGKTPDATLALPFEVAKAGRYAVRLTAGNGPEQGACEIQVDGKPAAQADFRAGEESEADLALGTHELAAGRHMLTFKASASAGRPGLLTLEMLRLLPLPPEVKRKTKGDDEAHFVRLGIGRAVYAYRLAYDKLPDSLQALVDSGIMPAQFLKDENGNPLKSRIESDYFLVESTAEKGGWSHHWKGLDARR